MQNKKHELGKIVRALPQTPGVYLMKDRLGQVIYVGKAKNLKNRLSSYFVDGAKTLKTHVMVNQIKGVELTITRTEGEALLLENNLIKSLKPRYNVLLKDDKSYPYIHVDTQQDFPRLNFHRGARNKPGRYFGPYPSAGAVRQTLNLLEKTFQLRQCEESYFRNRSRPCLQYQIKRCSGSCTGLITQVDYYADMELAMMFLEGKSDELIQRMAARMEAAAERLEFEQAAHVRDQITRLRRVFERQLIDGVGGDMDVVACVMESGLVCVQIMFVRQGRHLGGRAQFLIPPSGNSPEDVLERFLAQAYLDTQPPAEILINEPLADSALLESVFSDRAGYKVKIRARTRGDRARQVQLAEANALQALRARLAADAGMLERFESLQEAFGLDELPRRLECFDISHTQGEATVGSCVVFDQAGAVKSDYRRFNISGITPGDDYAAMNQVLRRRYKAVSEGAAPVPDVLLVDGGKGQLAQAEEILNELGVEGILLVGVAKGVDRRAGLEQLFLPRRGTPISLPSDSPALLLIQQIRDESHRFAITGHRQRRAKARRISRLEEIAGLGPKRRAQLLRTFGGLHEVRKASVDELERVEGISRALATRIYESFHD
ncbi:MAG: excinuclease ABC subunit UvrC [Gammaproteobacteria bacterium]